MLLESSRFFGFFDYFQSPKKTYFCIDFRLNAGFHKSLRIRELCFLHTHFFYFAFRLFLFFIVCFSAASGICGCIRAGPDRFYPGRLADSAGRTRRLDTGFRCFMVSHAADTSCSFFFEGSQECHFVSFRDEGQRPKRSPLKLPNFPPLLGSVSHHSGTFRPNR